MKDTIEIRWHGRGGQGAKTAALGFEEEINSYTDYQDKIRYKRNHLVNIH